MNRVSNCCHALVEVAGRTTQYYVCRACRKPCDVTSWREPAA